MMKEKNNRPESDMIAVFTETLRVSAYIYLDSFFLEPSRHLSKENHERLASVIESLKSKAPLVRKELIQKDKITVAFEPVLPAAVGYSQAIVDLLKYEGFIAKLIPSKLKSLMTYVSESLEFEAREKILAEIANLPTDIEPEAAQGLLEVLKDLKG